VDDERFEATLVLRRRNEWLLGLTALFAALSLLLNFVAPLLLLGPGLAFVAFSAVLLARVLRRNTWPILAAVPVGAGADGLRAGGLRVARTHIADAQLVPREGGASYVRVTRSRGLPIELNVRDQEEGRRLVRALGFDAAKKVTRIEYVGWATGKSWTIAAQIGLLAIAVTIGLSIPILLLLPLQGWFLWALPLLSAVALGVFFAFARSRVDVGADGLMLLDWRRQRRRFIPSAKIVRVERYVVGGGGGRPVVGAAITLEGGEVLEIPLGMSGSWDEDRALAVVDRIREALETCRRGPVDPSASLLGRRGRDVRGWMDDLRAIGSGANATLRIAPVQPEVLWRVLESPGAAVEERAAAAVALARALDDDGRTRLRIAAAAVAETNLRIVLDAAATEDEGALEEALGEASALSVSR